MMTKIKNWFKRKYLNLGYLNLLKKKGIKIYY